MSSYVLPKQLNELASALARFPGIGPKMATRLSIYMIAKASSDATTLAEAISSAVSDLGICPKTGNLTVGGEIDKIYLDEGRDRSKLLIVETPVDLIQIEESGAYDGLYLVLGGLISPLTGVSPDDLAVDKLNVLLQEGDFSEVILALSSTVEGEATNLYLTNIIEQTGAESIKVSKLARGLPSGSSVEFLDSATLRSALSSRISIE